MSVLSGMYNIDFTVKRFVQVSGNRFNTASAIVSGARGLVRPITDQAQLFNHSNWGKEFDLFCEEDVDIKANDLVVIEDDEYAVAGVSMYEDLEDDGETHQKVRMSLKA